MSEHTAPRPVDLVVHAALDGWPVDIALSLPAEKVRAALARLAELGFTPGRTAQAAAPAGLRNEGPPTCPVHGTAKVKPSNHGSGYFCAAKNADGSYCKEKPV